MNVLNYLDASKVHHELMTQTSLWAIEGDGRNYVREGDKLAVTKGRRGICGTIEEWKDLLKLITPEVLETIQGLLEDFDDLERKQVVWHNGKYET